MSNKHVLLLDPTLACKIGLNEAIVLHQLSYWQNKYPGKWIYNSYETWHQQFTFWSARTIQRVFASLERSGFVEAKRTKVCKIYRLCPEKISKLLDNQDDTNCQSTRHYKPDMMTGCQQDETNCDVKPANMVHTYNRLHKDYYKEYSLSHNTAEQETRIKESSSQDKLLTDSLQISSVEQVVDKAGESLISESFENGGSNEISPSLLVFTGSAKVSAVEFKQGAEVEFYPTVCIQESQQQDVLSRSKLTGEAEYGLKLSSKASTATPESPTQKHKGKLRAEALKELVAIWEKNIPPAGRPLTLTDVRAKQLEKLFRTHLKACVDEWQKFVELITASDFLMGKSSKFRVSFDWALKEPNALKIMEGSYKNQGQKAEVERKAPDPLELLEQDTSMDPTWKLFLQKLIKRFGDIAYELWLSTMQMVSCNDGTLKVSVPTEAHHFRIENDYGAYINVTAKNLFGVVRIRFEVREELCKA